MSATDPRMAIKNLLLAVTGTFDDDATPADIMVVYTGSPENYKQWFYIYDYDAVITVDPPRLWESGDRRRIDFEPLRHDGRLGVHVSAVDKTGLTATKLLNKIKVSMNTAIGAASADTYEYNAWIETVSEIIAPMGGYDPIWRQNYIIAYRPLSGIY